MKKILLIPGLLLSSVWVGGGQTPQMDVTELEAVVVTETSLLDSGSPIVDQETGKIYAGKKITRATFEDRPQPSSANVRALFSRTPGVFVSEMGDPSIINITIRGIGEPHESQDILAFQDGIPIQSTLFGYPTLYYAPPSEYIQEIEVIKGGSSLIYGPQPAGVVNFITRDPVEGRPLQYDQTTLFGSHGMVSTYQQVSGTSGDAGYLASFYHRQADGFRDVNADYSLFNGNLKFFWDLTEQTRIELEYTAYEEESGEPGRLTFAQWQAAPNQVLAGNVNDRLFISKHFGAATLTHDFSDETRIISKTFGHYQQRLTRRNNGAATRTDVDDRLFSAIGNDTRLIHEYELYEGEVLSTFTGGWTTYYSLDPNRRNRVGAVTLDTTGLPPFQHQDRETFYQAFFAENVFEYGGLRLIPSARVDLVNMHVRNNAVANVGVTGSEFHIEPLLGIALEYDLPYESTAYFSFAQGYQPLQYDQILRRGAAAPNPDSRPGETNTFELGVRGTPASWINFDVGGFHVDYKNFVDVNEDGNDNVLILNAGDLEIFGIELAMEMSLSGMIDEYFDTSLLDTIGDLGFFTTAEFLTTEFVAGPFVGNEASYAPGYSVRFGPTYQHESGVKVELTASYVDDSFWNTSNAASFTPTSTNVGTNLIESYAVWDLAIEVPIYRDTVRLIFGINNLFDEQYYARVRADGIQTTDRRNYYGGFSTTF